MNLALFAGLPRSRVRSSRRSLLDRLLDEEDVVCSRFLAREQKSPYHARDSVREAARAWRDQVGSAFTAATFTQYLYTKAGTPWDTGRARFFGSWSTALREVLQEPYGVDLRGGMIPQLFHRLTSPFPTRVSRIRGDALGAELGCATRTHRTYLAVSDAHVSCIATDAGHSGFASVRLSRCTADMVLFGAGAYRGGIDAVLSQVTARSVGAKVGYRAVADIRVVDSRIDELGYRSGHVGTATIAVVGSSVTRLCEDAGEEGHLSLSVSQSPVAFVCTKAGTRGIATIVLENVQSSTVGYASGRDGQVSITLQDASVDALCGAVPEDATVRLVLSGASVYRLGHVDASRATPASGMVYTVGSVRALPDIPHVPRRRYALLALDADRFFAYRVPLFRHARVERLVRAGAYATAMGVLGR